MHLNKDKEFIKLSFKNLKKLDSTIAKAFTIDDPKFEDIENVDVETF